MKRTGNLKDNLTEQASRLILKISRSERGIYFFTFVLIEFSSVILLYFRSTLENSHLGLLYLLIVIAVGAMGGTRPALFASALSFLSWNFLFLKPYYTFQINDSRDWILLFIFLGIGIIVGQITGNLRIREKETEALYRASLSVNRSLDIEQALKLMAEQIISNIGSRGCAIIRLHQPVDADHPKYTVAAGAGDIEKIGGRENQKIIDWVIKNRKSVGLAELPEFRQSEDMSWPESISRQDIPGISLDENDLFLLLEMNEKPLGVMYVRMGQKPPIFHYRFVVIISLIVVSALEKYRLIEEKTKALAFRESDHLKSILFSSITHNLKNPLVSITATLSSLRLEDMDDNRKDKFSEHFSLMEEDVKRLTENIDKLLNLAQLKSGIWKPRFDWYDIREVVSLVVDRFSDRDYERLIIEIPDEFMLIWVDLVQMGQVLRHLVENALKYSMKESKITIGAKVTSDSVLFWVKNMGTGNAGAKDEIQAFGYKGEEGSSLERINRGTGLGLAICQEIVKYHNGTISVDNTSDEEYLFEVVLPIKLPDM